MRQDQRGASGHQPIQRLLDHRLVLRVHRRQRLVQHQDRRVAQQRPGDGDALALAARQARAAFADHGLVAVGQRLDEVVRVGGAGDGDEVGLAGVGAAQTQVVLDRAVEQVGVLCHHRDHPAHCLGIERAQVVAADTHRAALRIVQTEQQADDGRFAGTAGADNADTLAGGDAERQALMRGAPAAGVGEAHGVERDVRRQPVIVIRAQAGRGRDMGWGCRRGDRLIEQRVDAGRCRLAGQALVQHRAQLAQRAEDLRAGHQHDQQRLEAHLAVADPIRAERQRRGGTEGAAEVGNAARQDAGAEYQERAVGQRAGLVGQHPSVGAALAERLQGRQALHRVEELLAECLEGALTLARRRAGALVHNPGCHQGEQCGAQHHRGDGDIPERHEGEDREWRKGGDRHLRDVLAEEGLQLLDAVDDRQHHTAGTLRAEPSGTERDDLVVEAPAQRFLHARRGAVRDHGAHVVEPGPQQDRGERAHQRHHQFGASAPRGTGGRGTGRGRRSAQCRWRAPAGQAGCPARSATADRWSSATVSGRSAQIPSRAASLSWASWWALRKRDIFNRC